MPLAIGSKYRDIPSEHTSEMLPRLVRTWNVRNHIVDEGALTPRGVPLDKTFRSSN